MFRGIHLLVQLDVLHDLQRKGEITEQTVDTEEADDTEVAEQLVEWPSAVLANNLAAHTCCVRHINGPFVTELTRSLLHFCLPEGQSSAH